MTTGKQSILGEQNMIVELKLFKKKKRGFIYNWNDIAGYVGTAIAGEELGGRGQKVNRLERLRAAVADLDVRACGEREYETVEGHLLVEDRERQADRRTPRPTHQRRARCCQSRNGVMTEVSPLWNLK
jgi:hypothetical protein